MMYAPNSYGLALDVFDQGASGLAVLEILTASGLIIGGLIFSRLSLSGDKNRFVVLSLVAMGSLFVVVSFSESFYLSVALLGLGGIANVGVFVPSITMFQQTPATADKGRLISLRAGFGQLGIASGFLLGGALGATLGITRVFLVSGLIGIGLTLALYLPYRVAADRRARVVRAAAVAAGATRCEAREAAAEAALGLHTSDEMAWAAAAATARGGGEDLSLARAETGED
jgi:MFS family permease